MNVLVCHPTRGARLGITAPGGASLVVHVHATSFSSPVNTARFVSAARTLPSSTWRITSFRYSTPDELRRTHQSMTYVGVPSRPERLDTWIIYENDSAYVAVPGIVCRIETGERRVPLALAAYEWIRSLFTRVYRQALFSTMGAAAQLRPFFVQANDIRLWTQP